MFGEHNRLIFNELLRLGEDELAALYEKRVIADAPPNDLPRPIRLPQ